MREGLRGGVCGGWGEGRDRGKESRREGGRALLGKAITVCNFVLTDVLKEKNYFQVLHKYVSSPGEHLADLHTYPYPSFQLKFCVVLPLAH